MRVFFFAYFLIEVLAFLAVSRLIGVGWAFLAVFALMMLGGVAANVALRSSLRKAAEGELTLGAFAGDSAILVTGWIMTIIPGFVSSLVGLLMVFRPTRALMRRGLTAKAQRSMEDFGVRAYSSSPMSKFHTTYGTFTTPAETHNGSAEEAAHDYIDADELEKLFNMKSAEGNGTSRTNGSTRTTGEDHTGRKPEDPESRNQ